MSNSSGIKITLEFTGEKWLLIASRCICGENWMSSEYVDSMKSIKAALLKIQNDLTKRDVKVLAHYYKLKDYKLDQIMDIRIGYDKARKAYVAIPYEDNKAIEQNGMLVFRYADTAEELWESVEHFREVLSDG